jgi:hypothetical protein
VKAEDFDTRKSKLVPVICAIALLASSAVAFAGTIQLPQTGQTRCYDVAGTEISCAGTGQDGEFQTGAAWPDPRFSVSGDCVTDNLTGLMWVKSPGSALLVLQDAIDHAGGLDICGYTDWRLPNVIELESLVNVEYNKQTCGGSACISNAAWLNTQGFSNVQTFYYWSSTTYAYNVGYAWFMHMWNGYTLFNSKDGSFYHVWPVRGGEAGGTVQLPATGQTVSYMAGDNGDLQTGAAWPSPRFVDNGNGTVTDNLSGLLWLKDANCFGSRTWEQALADANSLANGICGLSDGSVAGDWRLANRKELFSLVDYEYFNPALSGTVGSWQWSPGDLFDNVQPNYYWSSTTSAPGAGFAWSVDLWGGVVGSGDKKTSHFVWPVSRAMTLDFNDVPLNYWAYNYISALFASEITGGCGNGNYCPDDPVTRAQMAVFIVKALGETPAATCSGMFDDVNEATGGNLAFCKYIEKFSTLGITAGCGSNNFCPNDPVTRDQMAVFITKAMGEAAASCTGNVFNDVDGTVMPSAFCGFIEKFSTLGITSGCGGGNFCPGELVTRAQMAVFLTKGFLQ